MKPSVTRAERPRARLTSLLLPTCMFRLEEVENTTIAFAVLGAFAPLLLTDDIPSSTSDPTGL